MKKVNALLVASIFGVFSVFAGEVSIESPLDARFYSKDGKRVITNLLFGGETILTQDNDLIFKVNKNAVLLAKNSVMVLSKIEANEVELFLVSGALELNKPSASGDALTVLTPSSKYLVSDGSLIRITSTADKESVDVNTGVVYAFNSIRETTHMVSKDQSFDLFNNQAMMLKGIDPKITQTVALNRLGAISGVPSDAPVFTQKSPVVKKSVYYPDPVEVYTIKTVADMSQQENTGEVSIGDIDLGNISFVAEAESMSKVPEKSKNYVDTKRKKGVKYIYAPVIKPTGFGVKFDTYSEFIQTGEKLEKNPEFKNTLFKVRFNPYITTGPFTFEARLEFRSSHDTVNRGNKLTPIFAESDYYYFGDVRAAIASVAQLINTLTVDNYLYISRDIDLPLDINNMNIAKHRHNNGIMPALVNVKIPHFRLQLFHQDLLYGTEYFADNLVAGNNKKEAIKEIDGTKAYNPVSKLDIMLEGPSSYPLIFGASGWYTPNIGADGAEWLKGSLVPSVRIGLPFGARPLGLMLTGGIFEQLGESFNFDNYFAGAYFYIQKSSLKLAVGADWNKGRLFTARNGVTKEYNDSIVPYIGLDLQSKNVDFDFSFSLPVELNGSFDLTFSDLNCLLGLGIKPVDGLKISITENAVNLVRGFFSTDEGQKSWYSYLPEIELIGKFGGLSASIKYETLDTRSEISEDRFTHTYQGKFSFWTSFALGSDYFFSTRNSDFMLKMESKKASLWQPVIYAKLGLITAMTDKGVFTIGNNDDALDFSLIPYIGVRGPKFTFVAKIPTFDFAGTVKDGFTNTPFAQTFNFIDELNIFGILTYKDRKKGTSEELSVMVDEPFSRDMTFDLKIGKVFNMKFWKFDTTVGIIDMLIGKNTQVNHMPFDLRLGWIGDRVKFYADVFGVLGSEDPGNWKSNNSLTSFPSVYLDYALDNGFSMKAGFATSFNFNRVDGVNSFSFGLSDFSGNNYAAVGALGFGYDKNFRAGVTLGYEGGNGVYKYVDSASQIDAIGNINTFTYHDENSQNIDLTTADLRHRLFAEAKIGYTFQKNINLDISYIIPFSYNFNNIFNDRLITKFIANAGSFEAFAAFEFKGLIKPYKSIAGSNNRWNDIYLNCGIKAKSIWGSIELEYKRALSTSPVANGQYVNQFEFKTKLGIF